MNGNIINIRCADYLYKFDTFSNFSAKYIVITLHNWGGKLIYYHY